MYNNQGLRIILYQRIALGASIIGGASGLREFTPMLMVSIQF